MALLVLVVLLPPLAGVLAAQSLDELAEKEKEKKKDPNAKSFSDDDLKKYQGTQASPSPPPKGTKAASPPPHATPGPDSSGQRKAEEARWRARGASARAAIERAEKRVAELQAAYDAQNLDAGANPEGLFDPNRLLKAEERKRSTLAQIEQAKASVAAAKQSLLDLEDEARRKSIPPGWIRE